jgi:hypothetical protein
VGIDRENVRRGSKGPGRPSETEGRLRISHLLRHLHDPIELQRSSLSSTKCVQTIAETRYPNGVIARGRALNDLLLECLQELENELDGHPRVMKLKTFITLTRHGKGVTEASKAIGVTPEYASRHLKRITIELLADKLAQKLH